MRRATKSCTKPARREGAFWVCDCFEKCPLCGQIMEPYTPDLCANTYGKGGKRELQIIRVCNNIAAHVDHFPY